MSAPDTKATPVNQEMQKPLRDRCRYDLSEEIARKFMLASALEPLAVKDGCTTRLADLKDSKKLEFFVSAGINSGFAIARLVKYLQRERTFAGAYRFFPEAVAASKLNRRGGKINQGILEPIFPIIGAQVLCSAKLKSEPLQVFRLATELLKTTSPKDVENLIRGKELANKISDVEDKYPVQKYNVSTVHEYYLSDMITEHLQHDLTGELHNKQFVTGFHDIELMLGVMLSSEKPGILEKSVQAYDAVRMWYCNKIGVGLAADHCAICMYIYLSLMGDRFEI